MNYEEIDLNLLLVFDAVMTELNVTRAAEHLHMTQPAVSNALKRLRATLNNELFVKVPSGVSPTTRATEVWLAIRDALAQIRQTIQPCTFDPANSTAIFTFSMADYAASLMIPPIITHIERSAPNIDIRVIPNTNINAPELLEQGDVDIAIGVFPNCGPRFRMQTLLTETYVCAMRPDHPLAKELTLERFAQAKHLLISLTGEATGFLDQRLESKGLKRRIALTVNQFALAPVVVANSDLICTLAYRTAKNFGLEDKLHLAPLPLDLEPTSINMMWHERNHLDSAHVWLRSLLMTICENL